MPHSARSRAYALFDSYVDLSPAERAHALRALEDDQPDVHAELVQLLTADATDDTELDSAPYRMLIDTAEGGAPSEAALLPGTRLGAWRIGHQIGAGGMGAVYSAQRADGQYQQTVAIKCLRAELASPRLIEAFLHERNTLAKLDHPNIARLLDGGVDAEGRPWFAMQLVVRGETVDRWCDRLQLDVRERVSLLIQACDAVAYAHANGVVHEDIKASNLLVTEDGRPMLLDFGLSRLLSPDEGHTAGRLAVSDGYTAPEALEGLPPAPTGDIYALGVLLYRLLCADWPSDPNGAIPLKLDPALPLPPRAPSALARHSVPHIARNRRQPGPKHLSGYLSGDLDSIALRCVALDPLARYQTVAEMRADLQHWLRGEPVLARNGGGVYRLGRYLRRHALPTAFGAIALACLLATASFVVWQHQQARKDLELIAALAEFFATTPGGARLAQWGTQPLNTRDALGLSERALRASPLAQDPEALARGLLNIASGYFAISDQNRGFALLDEAERLRSGNATFRARARAVEAAALNAAARPVLAERAARSGLGALGYPLTSTSKTLAVQLDTEIAKARWQRGERKQALAMLDGRLETVDAASESYPKPLMVELLTLRSDWGNQLHMFSRSRQDAQRAIEIAGGSATLLARAREQLATNLGETGAAPKAVDTASRSLEQARREYGDGNPQTGIAWIVLAEAQQAAGNPGDAYRSAANALRILLPVVGDQHVLIARALRISSLARLFLGQAESAVADARRAVAIVDAIHGRRHEVSVRTRQALALGLGYLSESGTNGAALLEESLSQYRSLIADGESLGLPMSRELLAYGIRLGNSGRVGESRAVLQRALPQLRREYGDGSDYVFEARRSLATLLMKEHRTTEARAALEAFADSLRGQQGSSLYRSAALSDTLLDLANLDLAEGDIGSARARLQQALDVNSARFGRADPHTRAIQASLDRLSRLASGR